MSREAIFMESGITLFIHKQIRRLFCAEPLEVIGLAFENAEDFEKAKNNVTRLKKKCNSDYEFLVTDFVPKNADKALIMLNHVMSFPTTIFIDKKGNVRKIRTGYSGPATGTEYDKLVKEITFLTESLLKE